MNCEPIRVLFLISFSYVISKRDIQYGHRHHSSEDRIETSPDTSLHSDSHGGSVLPHLDREQHREDSRYCARYRDIPSYGSHRVQIAQSCRCICHIGGDPYVALRGSDM